MLHIFFIQENNLKSTNTKALVLASLLLMCSHPCFKDIPCFLCSPCGDPRENTFKLLIFQELVKYFILLRLLV